MYLFKNVTLCTFFAHIDSFISEKIFNIVVGMAILTVSVDMEPKLYQLSMTVQKKILTLTD